MRALQPSLLQLSKLLIAVNSLLLLWVAYCFSVGESKSLQWDLDLVIEPAVFLVFYVGLYQVQFSGLRREIRLITQAGLSLLCLAAINDWLEEVLSFPAAVEQLLEVMEAGFLLGLIIVSVGLNRWVLVQRDKIELQKKSIDKFRNRSRTDGLTNLNNRAFFDQEIVRLCRQAEGFDQPLSLMMVDLDHFKSINDRFGHAVGDQVLRMAASQMVERKRSEDVCFRYGGEEFAMLLPETTAQEAEVVAERLRRAIEQLDLTAVHNQLSLTASIGITQWCLGDKTDELIVRADAALYQAKAKGRNTVHVR